MLEKRFILFITVSSFLFSQEKDDLLVQGKQIYTESCAVCHGLSGKGDGVVAGNLEVKPRNFTDGKFKVRSTKSGQVPLDEDLYRILGRGMGHDNAMPTWSHLPPNSKHAVIAYLKTFAPKKFARQWFLFHLEKQVQEKVLLPANNGISILNARNAMV